VFRKLFNAKWELEMVGYFKQAAELHYGLSNFPFNIAKRTVVITDSWEGGRTCWWYIAQRTKETSRVILHDITQSHCSHSI